MHEDEAFGHWLAGFIDGEGSFNIPRGHLRKGHSCRLDVGLRIDDADILREIQGRLGIGRIYERTTGRGGCRVCTWTVMSKPDCLALVQLLDRYPLRAKKAKDYAVWREAVIEWQTTGPGGDWKDPLIRASRAASCQRMAGFRAALLAGRVHV